MSRSPLGEDGGPRAPFSVGVAGLVQVDQTHGSQGLERGEVEAGGAAFVAQCQVVQPQQQAERVPLPVGRREVLGMGIGHGPIPGVPASAPRTPAAGCRPGSTGTETSLSPRRIGP